MSRGNRTARERPAAGWSPFLPTQDDVVAECARMREAGVTRAELRFPVSVRQLWLGEKLRIEVASLSREDVLRARASFDARLAPVSRLYLSRGGYDELRSNPEWVNYFDPVGDYDALSRGRVGTLLGMELLTDAFDPPEEPRFIGSRNWMA